MSGKTEGVSSEYFQAIYTYIDEGWTLVDFLAA
jgi:hypothetical protein